MFEMLVERNIVVNAVNSFGTVQAGVSKLTFPVTLPNVSRLRVRKAGEAQILQRSLSGN